MARRTCQADLCSKLIPDSKRADAKYCSTRCSRRMAARRERAKKAAREGRTRRATLPVEDTPSVEFKTRDESKDGRGSARKPPDLFLRSPYPQMILDGAITTTECARQYGEYSGQHVTSQAVSRWKAWLLSNEGRLEALANWERAPEVEEALADFGKFCGRYWPEDQITEFHMEWADLISEAIDTGGRCMLLAAQRHGKSHLLRKYAVWRICRNPDMRILWVSQSADLAKKAVGYVLDILSQNTQLMEDVLGPGNEFRPPPRQNMSWTSEEFTVGCRSRVQASPTMVALGKGGSILSRDADVLIVDDLQEHKHIRSPSIREKDEEWFFTDLMSRKLPNTGLAMIGSRQHVDDVYSKVLERSNEWTVRVYPVHDPACTIPEDDHEAHDAAGCMLWPEQYPHAYMQEQRAQQGEAYFQRNMMNDPSDDALTYVTASDLEQHKSARFEGGLPPRGGRLIAGIDPASAKPVAGVLWSFVDGKRYLIDAIEAAPGTKGAREVMQTFYNEYGCRTYVVEKNGYQGEILRDGELQAMVKGLGLRVRPHYTSTTSKWDEGSGVVKMLHRLRNPEGPMVLPAYGADEVMARLERVYRQWLTFDPDFVNSKHAKDDLVMASWFPQLVMDDWEKGQMQKVEVAFESTQYVNSDYMAGV